MHCYQCDRSQLPSSQIVSKSKFSLLSYPQTLHLFLLSLRFLLPNRSEPALIFLLALSSACSSISAAALSLAICSASLSASGESGIVSREEMLGDLERVDVGVDADDEDMLTIDGYVSLKVPLAKEGVDVLALSDALGVKMPC